MLLVGRYFKSRVMRLKKGSGLYSCNAMPLLLRKSSPNLEGIFPEASPANEKKQIIPIKHWNLEGFFLEISLTNESDTNMTQLNIRAWKDFSRKNCRTTREGRKHIPTKISRL